MTDINNNKNHGYIHVDFDAKPPGQPDVNPFGIVLMADPIWPDLVSIVTTVTEGLDPGWRANCMVALGATSRLRIVRKEKGRKIVAVGHIHGVSQLGDPHIERVFRWYASKDDISLYGANALAEEAAGDYADDQCLTVVVNGFVKGAFMPERGFVKGVDCNALRGGSLGRKGS